MYNLTEIRQCLRRRHRKFSVGSPLVIEGVRALTHTCFPKVYIFYGALGLGVYGCICARSAPQGSGPFFPEPGGGVKRDGWGLRSSLLTGDSRAHVQNPGQRRLPLNRPRLAVDDKDWPTITRGCWLVTPSDSPPPTGRGATFFRT